LDKTDCLWVILIHIVYYPIFLIVLSIPASVIVSRADVASSSNSNYGFFNNARAIATLCFWPPESWLPLLPTKVSIPSCKASTKSIAYAFFKDKRSSCSVASGFTKSKLFFIDVAKRTGYCPTYPIRVLSHSRSSYFKSTPSKNTVPSSGS